ncbi:Hypothetical predicted protein, partial [Marmota monax]
RGREPGNPGCPLSLARRTRGGERGAGAALCGLRAGERAGSAPRRRSGRSGAVRRQPAGCQGRTFWSAPAGPCPWSPPGRGGGPGRRRGMQALNITPERFSRLLRDHNLTREQFIALYGLRPLVYTPELPARAKLALVLTGVLIFALALFGNALVVYVVTRSKAVRRVTNIFICSLALSDLLIAFFCIPVTMLQNVSDTWLGGESPSRAPAPSPRVSSTPRYRPEIGVLGLFSILLHGVDCQ